MFPSGIETLEKILRNVSNRVVLHNNGGDDDDCDDDVNDHDENKCKGTSATDQKDTRVRSRNY